MRRLALAVFGMAILAACGGGGGGGTTGGSGIVPSGPTPTPTATSSSQTFSSSDAAAIPSAAPGATTVAVPLSADTTSGASANAALPAAANVPADTTVSFTYSSIGDASLPPLSARRAALSRSVRDGVTKDALAYLKVQFSADLSLPQAPGFTFTVPGTVAPSGVNYWLAFYDPLRAAAGWQEGFEGPATVSAATVNGKAATKFVFASNGQPISFVANQTYWFAVIAIVAAAPTPTPVPTTVPTNAPPTGKPSKVLATPANVQFASLADAPVTVTFAETGYAGLFSLHGDCTGIVNTTGSSPTWTVTPVGQGRCVIVALGDRGATAVVHIGVVTPFETPHPRPSESPEASPSPGASHSPEPSHSPDASPSPGASHSPEPSESPEPTHAPTATPSPTVSRSPEPTHSPTATPTATPTLEPTASPTASPAVTPSPVSSSSPNPH